MTLSQSILQLQQQIAGFATNPYFEALDDRFLNELEKQAPVDKGAHYFVGKLGAVIQRIKTVDDIPNQRELLYKLRRSAHLYCAEIKIAGDGSY
jgi:hypothetical protein